MKKELKARIDKAQVDTVNLIQVEKHARASTDLNVVQSLKNQFLIIDLLQQVLNN